MRSALLLPLALATAVGVAACGTASADNEQTAYQAPRRDLTLPASEPAEVEVASPVELARAPVQAQKAHSARRVTKRPVPKPTPARLDTVETRAPAALSVSMAAAPAAEAEAADPHALAPGQTVTVLTASTASANDGPSHGDWTDQLPADRGRGTTIRGGGGRGCGHGGRPVGGGGFRGLR